VDVHRGLERVKVVFPTVTGRVELEVGFAVVKSKEAASALTLEMRHSMVAEPKIKPKRGTKFIIDGNLQLLYMQGVSMSTHRWLALVGMGISTRFVLPPFAARLLRSYSPQRSRQLKPSPSAKRVALNPALPCIEVKIVTLNLSAYTTSPLSQCLSIGKAAASPPGAVDL